MDGKYNQGVITGYTVTKTTLVMGGSNKVYKKVYAGKYTYSDNAAIKFGMVYAATESSALNNITVVSNFNGIHRGIKEKFHLILQVGVDVFQNDVVNIGA